MPGEPLQLGVALPPLSALADLSAEEIQREGGSRAYRYLLASNGSEYYCKGPSLTPGHPYLGANEWVAAGLARRLAIPVRELAVIEWDGSLLVGVELLPNARKMTGPLNAATWQRLSNAPAVAYDVAVLDGWTLNTDRHEQNWLGVVLGPDRGLFMVNDHDLALMGINRPPAELAQLAQTPLVPEFFRTAVIRDAIIDAHALEAAVARAQAVEDQLLANLVGQVPGAWLSDGEKEHVLRFLRDRRDHLGDLFEHGHNLFPNLGPIDEG